MDGKGHCVDKVFTEWLWSSLKYEEVCVTAHGNFPKAREGIRRRMNFYNPREE